MARNDHAHDADQVTPTPGSDVRDPQSMQLELASGLGARRHLDRMLAVHGRDGDGVAEHGLRDGNRELVEQVLTTSDQVRVRSHTETQVEVPGGTAARTRLALAGQAQGDVIVDARG